MSLMMSFATIALILILARALTELWLGRLNERHVREHADEVPPAFRAIIDEATYRRSVDYTLTKSRFGAVVTVFDAVLLIVVLFSGVLPWAFENFATILGTSIWATARTTRDRPWPVSRRWPRPTYRRIPNRFSGAKCRVAPAASIAR